MAMKSEAVTQYWLEHYAGSGHCGLCGNWGFIDTGGTRTPAGVEVGALHYCICPNGQALRAGRCHLEIELIHKVKHQRSL